MESQCCVNVVSRLCRGLRRGLCQGLRRGVEAGALKINSHIVAQKLKPLTTLTYHPIKATANHAATTRMIHERHGKEKDGSLRAQSSLRSLASRVVSD